MICQYWIRSEHFGRRSKCIEVWCPSFGESHYEMLKALTFNTPLIHIDPQTSRCPPQQSEGFFWWLSAPITASYHQNYTRKLCCFEIWYYFTCSPGFHCLFKHFFSPTQAAAEFDNLHTRDPVNEICSVGIDWPHARFAPVSVTDVRSKQNKKKSLSPKLSSCLRMCLLRRGLRAPLICLPAILISAGGPLHLSHLCGCFVMSATWYWIRASKEEGVRGKNKTQKWNQRGKKPRRLEISPGALFPFTTKSLITRGRRLRRSLVSQRGL